MATDDATTDARRVQTTKKAAPVRTDAASHPPPLDDTSASNVSDESTDAAVRPASLEIEVIPGSEVLGRGIYVRPRQPYELRDFLFKRANTQHQLRYVSGFEKPYLVPGEYEVNDSPPLPAGRSTGQAIIEESWTRFDRELALNANAAASAKVFSIDSTAFQGSSLKSEQDSYYALRSTFIPFWSVYMPNADTKNVIEEFQKLEDQEKPGESDHPYLCEGPFDPLNRSSYAQVFERFGTHYVRCAWIGGKASLVFVVTKSSRLSKEDVKAGIEVAFTGEGKAGISAEQNETRERFRSNSSCTVFGNGGDPTQLAKLTTLDPQQYGLWIDSVKNNPEIIEFGVAGIWTLLKDPVKAEALQHAYVQESKFTPLDAIVPVKEWLVFIKGDEAFDYAMTLKYGSSRLYVLSCLFRPHMIKDPEKLRDELIRIFDGATDTQLAEAYVTGAGIPMQSGERTIEHAVTALRVVPTVDLKRYLAKLLNMFVLSGESILERGPLKQILSRRKSTNKFNSHTQHLLKDGSLHVVMLNRLLLEEAFPDELRKRSSRLSLLDYLPALDQYPHFQRPQAAFSLYGFGKSLESKIYLFKWQECLRIDINTESIDAGYPRPIAEEWPGVDFDRMDAAVSVAPSRVYFFRGMEYIRVDMRDSRWEGGTRDLIKDRWPGVIFDKIDTAAYWGGNKIYFFFEDQYTRYDFSSHRADPGYPKFLSSNYVEDWELFE